MSPADSSRFHGLKFDHIRTQELALLLRNAEQNGFGDAPHAVAYRAELLRRAAEALATPTDKEG